MLKSFSSTLGRGGADAEDTATVDEGDDAGAFLHHRDLIGRWWLDLDDQVGLGPDGRVIDDRGANLGVLVISELGPLASGSLDQDLESHVAQFPNALRDGRDTAFQRVNFAGNADFHRWGRVLVRFRDGGWT